MPVKLNHEQQKHLQSIRWLMHGGKRQCGKSWLMAFIFIEIGFKDLNNWVYVYDHGVDYMNHSKNRMLEIIKVMFSENVNEDIYTITISHHKKAFKISKNPNTSHKPSDWFI